MRRLTACIALALCALALSPASGLADTISGSITPTDSLQTGRLVRLGIESECPFQDASPGVLNPGTFYHFDAFTYINSSGAPQCVTVTLTATNSGSNLFSAAYAGSFNPGDPGANYLADAGISTGCATAPCTISYSFLVPAGGTYVVVVHEVGSSACVSCNYLLTVSGVATPVTLRSFSAVASPGGVTLRWRTASENQILGFNVYAQIGSRRVRLNHGLIRSKAAGGASYSFAFHPRRGEARPTRYLLQVVGLDGRRSWASRAQLRRPVA